MEERSDEDLLAGIARGDAPSGREMFLRYRARAYRVAYRMLGNDADAMDAVEDTFVKVLASADTFKGRASARTWFYRILVNTSLDMRRKRKRVLTIANQPDDEASDPRITGATGAGATGAGLDGMPSKDAGPGTLAERSELAAKIGAAIEKLSDKHRPVFVLTAVEGLSYRETADALGISIGTVMSRLFYARLYLRQSLKPYVEARDE